MRYLKILLINCLVLLLVSCAGYQQPNTGSFATIQGKRAQGAKLFDFFVVKAVDNQDAGIVWSRMPKVNISPGFHVITAKLTFSDVGFLSVKGQTAMVNLRLTAKAGEVYRLNGLIKGNEIFGWIEDSRGNRVSNEEKVVSLPLGSQLVDVPEMKR